MQSDSNANVIIVQKVVLTNYPLEGQAKAKFQYHTHKSLRKVLGWDRKSRLTFPSEATVSRKMLHYQERDTYS